MLTKKHYEDALEIQNACNLSGVVRSFAETMGDIWDEANEVGKGTDYVNRHPLVILYLDKLCQLAGLMTERDMVISEAYRIAFEQTRGNYA